MVVVLWWWLVCGGVWCVVVYLLGTVLDAV